MDEAEGGLLVFVQGGDLQVSFPLTMVLVFPSIKEVSGRSEWPELMDEMTLVCGGSLSAIVNLSSDEVDRVSSEGGVDVLRVGLGWRSC